MDALHDTKTMMVSAAVMASVQEIACRHESPFDNRKTKQRRGMSTSPPHGHKKSHTPEHQPLPPPPMFHSTPLAMHPVDCLLTLPLHTCPSIRSQKLASSPQLRGGRCPSHFVRERTNPGRCSIHSRSHNITIYVSLHLESHCRSHQTNLQSGLWRVTLKGVGCEGVR